MKISQEKLAELLAKARLAKSHSIDIEKAFISESPLNSSAELTLTGIGKHGEEISYNEKQLQFINLVSNLKSCVLIGAAGTGKTTCMMGAINTLIHSGKIPILQDTASHKHLIPGTPGIIACSFTRRAVSNLRKAMPHGMESNCITIHKLLEYQPVFYETEDPISGETKKSMRFEPTRNAFRPLPDTIKTLIIDESSMVSVDPLYKQLREALPHNPQFIFLGDIQQLPPVFGSAILGFKMIELPTVELTEVYRQALESPIIKYATQIKDGIGFMVEEKIVEETPKGKITFHPWKKKLSYELAQLTFIKFITTALDHGSYKPETDCILIPFNKAFGTDEINKHIANHIAKKNGREVWEIIAGYNKHYFSVGDRVMYDKEDATIIKIVRNGSYAGRLPQPESKTLDYWGYTTQVHSAEHNPNDIDFLLNQMSALTGTGDEDRVKAASHIITIKMDDSEDEIEIDTASELNAIILSYALTVHKSQGSEYDKVFLILHQSHNTMIQRELLYTAVTRAAKELYCICEPDAFMKGVSSQRVKGTTLAEKAMFFQGKLDSNGGVY